ncbi:hypothetical protein SAMN05421734_102341 [Pelagirhabdus alkalitolerans]|uniref:Coat F domain-containing protein n=1 Tax=Pelagirhabdus alkalitolerans TaxID=1612202 RepID=A0A1G6H855_9BACI|nr:hypothetical protein [Pelagirhabdus alkalitolerans]SDB90268.1 hypothetical protein SAMN05421734_102341 [Pelagirhabdus alkalitolerans]
MSDETKESLLIETVKTQHAILELLNSSLLETIKHQKSLPKDEQNQDLVHFSEQMRTVVARKPKLKNNYQKLNDQYGLSFND